MKSITLSVPDETYRQARIRAAENGTSVSALVAEFLRSLTDADSEFRRLEALQQRTMASIDSFSASARLSRDEVHSRALR